jgi:RHS repeat-associated protein
VGAGPAYTTAYRYLGGAGANSTTFLVAGVANGGRAELAYSYDAAGDITEVREGQALLARYSYDALGQLVRADDAAQLRTVTYSYDAGGNVTCVREHAYTLAPSPGALLAQRGYSYANPAWADQLTEAVAYAVANGAPTAVASSFSPAYDQVGNPLSWRDGMSMSWVRGRRLASVTSAGLDASYSYDDSGVRTSKTVNGATTAYVLSGSAILRQSSPSGTLDFAYDECGRAIGLSKGGTCYWYVFDLQGDVIGIVNASGAQVVSYSYDAWGRPTSVTGSMAGTIGAENPFRYRGYLYDAETGLYCLSSRYYDPEVGRFLNADGLVSTGQGVLGHNMYTYCNNSPVSNSDPSGSRSTGEDAGYRLTLNVRMNVLSALVATVTELSPSAIYVGAARPYSEVSGSIFSFAPNCYAYAIGVNHSIQPGDYSGLWPAYPNSVESVGASFEADMLANGFTIRRIDGPYGAINSNEYRIALAVGTRPYAVYPNGTPAYDYHFMVQTSSGRWAEKHGTGGDSVI